MGHCSPLSYMSSLDAVMHLPLIFKDHWMHAVCITGNWRDLGWQHVSWCPGDLAVARSSANMLSRLNAPYVNESCECGCASQICKLIFSSIKSPCFRRWVIISICHAGYLKRKINVCVTIIITLWCCDWPQLTQIFQEISNELYLLQRSWRSYY